MKKKLSLLAVLVLSASWAFAAQETRKADEGGLVKNLSSKLGVTEKQAEGGAGRGGIGLRRTEDPVREGVEVLGDPLLRIHLDHRSALVGRTNEEKTARSDERQRRHHERALLHGA